MTRAELITALKSETMAVLNALAALDALPAAPAHAEVVELAVWEGMTGDYCFIKPGRDQMGYGWTRLGTVRLPLVKGDGV